jgi:DNA-binding NtrC family response regulator
MLVRQAGDGHRAKSLSAVQAMKAGAYDYLTKLFKMD